MQTMKTTTCAHCRMKLTEGGNLIRVDEGVLGSTRFVSLDQPLYFCSPDCVREFFSPLPKADHLRRIA